MWNKASEILTKEDGTLAVPWKEEGVAYIDSTGSKEKKTARVYTLSLNWFRKLVCFGLSQHYKEQQKSKIVKAEEVSTKELTDPGGFYLLCQRAWILS